MPDPQVDHILQVVLAWATEQPRIRAVALVGSHARETARPDSDIDLLLLATDPDNFRLDTMWVEQINWHSIDTRLQNWQDEDYGAAWSRRVWLDPHSREIELAFVGLGWASANPIDGGTRLVISGGCRVLHDPDAFLVRLCRDVEALALRRPV